LGTWEGIVKKKQLKEFVKTPGNSTLSGGTAPLRTGSLLGSDYREIGGGERSIVGRLFFLRNVEKDSTPRKEASKFGVVTRRRMRGGRQE